jgi:hypothetical protein
MTTSRAMTTEAKLEPEFDRSTPIDFDDVDLVRGFSFHGPWGDAIVREPPPCSWVHGPKDVDNRNKPPPKQRIGRFFAVHTSQKVSRAGLDRLRHTHGYDWTEADLSPAGLILGVARIVGITRKAEGWCFGETWEGEPNYGWMLDTVLTFAEPIAGVSGMMGLWRPKEEHRLLIIDRMRTALAGRENRP